MTLIPAPGRVIYNRVCPDPGGEMRFVHRSVPLGCDGFSAQDGYNYSAFPGIVRFLNGDILVAFFRGTGHETANGRIVARRSTDGGLTLSSTDEVLVTTPGGWLNAMTVGGVSFSDPDPVTGRVYMTWFEIRDSGTTPYRRSMVRYTDDHGVTWSASVDPGAFDTEHTTSAGRIIPGPVAGMLLWPIYTRTIGQLRYTSRVLQSTDGNGAVWTQRGIIAQDASVNGRQFEEPVIDRLPDGRYMALIRVDSGDVAGSLIYRSYSADAITWDTPVSVFAGYGFPAWRALKSGRLVAFTRKPTGALHGILRTSADNGLSWTPEEVLADPAFETGKYSYSALTEIAPGIVALVHCQDLLAYVSVRCRLELALLREDTLSLPQTADSKALVRVAGYPHDGLRRTTVAAWWSALALGERVLRPSGAASVTEWRDLIGHVNMAPISGYAGGPMTLRAGPSASFVGPVVSRGSTGKLHATLALAQPFCLVFLLRSDQSGASGYVFDDEATTTLYLRHDAAHTFSMRAGGPAAITSPVIAGWPVGPRVVACVFDGASSELRINGAVVASGSVGTAALTVLRLGGTPGQNIISADYRDIVALRGRTELAAVEAALLARAA